MLGYRLLTRMNTQTQAKNRIISLVNSGRLEEARRECLAACKASPANAELWFILSAVCGQAKDFKAAEEYCRKALGINPSVPSAYYNLAVAQYGQGKTEDAISSLEKAVQLQAKFPAALLELGNIYLEREQSERAIDYYRKVIETMPDAYQAYAGKAIAYERSGNIESAIKACIESLRINPGQLNVVLRLAALYDRKDMVEEALRYYKQAIELGYDKPDVYVNLGRMSAIQHEQEEAEKFYIKALSIDSNNIEALTNLALLYDAIRKPALALEYIEMANQIGSNDERFVYNYAKILASAQQYSTAEEIYKKLLDNNPEFYEAAINLGNLYLLTGRADDAHEIYATACNSDEDNQNACSNMLMSMNYTNTFSNADVLKKHLAWGEKVESGVVKLAFKQRDRERNRIIRVGYVSPDFRNHSVAFFIEGILKYTTKTKIINYCYSDVLNEDGVTKRFREYADYWHDTTRLDNESLARLVNRDKIDVLVDLCGHMAGNRLPMFVHKPAPVQLTYLGYPNTTGLCSMDYRLVDKFTDPVSNEKMMSESPLYLEPSFLAYTPLANSPVVSELPYIDNGYITFGSFNNLAKMTDEVIEVWSRILSSVPGSRLCVKAKQYADESIKDQHVMRFQKAGVDIKRIDLISYSATIEEHLKSYNKIDIALDTFPYNGTTTTIEALWMGVPVICKLGDSHASRVGSSILNNTALNELLAANTGQYVDIACGLANNTSKLKDMRSRLRSITSDSVLLDTRSFAARFESLLTGLVK